MVLQTVNESTKPIRVDSDLDFPDTGIDLDRVVEDLELKLIREALKRSNGVKTKAAELLGLSFRQFRYKLSKYNREIEEMGATPR